MPGGLDQSAASMTLQALAGQAGFTATVTPVRCRVMMNVPTAAVPGTEISGTGYVSGGLTVTFGSPVLTPSGAYLLNTSTLTWTNGGVAAWTVAGTEFWDSAGTPRRLAYGLVDQQPLIVGPGSPLTFAPGTLAWSFP